MWSRTTSLCTVAKWVTTRRNGAQLHPYRISKRQPRISFSAAQNIFFVPTNLLEGCDHFPKSACIGIHSSCFSIDNGRCNLGAPGRERYNLCLCPCIEERGLWGWRQTKKVFHRVIKSREVSNWCDAPARILIE